MGKKCRMYSLRFFCLFSCLLFFLYFFFFFFFADAHFYLAGFFLMTANISLNLTADVKFSCCFCNKIRLLCFLFYLSL